MPEHPVVAVGYDGSPAACAAVERVGTSGHLYVVHGYRRRDDHLRYPHYRELAAETTARAVELVNRVDGVVGGMDRVRWDVEALGGSAARAIARVAAARGADEIIVGTRGFGRLRALLQRVAAQQHQAAHPHPGVREQQNQRAVLLAAEQRESPGRSADRTRACRAPSAPARRPLASRRSGSPRCVAARSARRRATFVPRPM